MEVLGYFMMAGLFATLLMGVLQLAWLLFCRRKQGRRRWVVAGSAVALFLLQLNLVCAQYTFLSREGAWTGLAFLVASATMVAYMLIDAGRPALPVRERGGR